MTNQPRHQGYQQGYQKRSSAKATVGEAIALARSSAAPAVMVARWAVALSLVAVVIACLALAAAL